MNGQWVWAFVPTLAPSSFSCDGPVPPPPFRTPMAPMAPMSMAMGPPGNMEWRPTPKKIRPPPIAFRPRKNGGRVRPARPCDFFPGDASNTRPRRDWPAHVAHFGPSGQHRIRRPSAGKRGPLDGPSAARSKRNRNRARRPGRKPGPAGPLEPGRDSGPAVAGKPPDGRGSLEPVPEPGGQIAPRPGSWTSTGREAARTAGARPRSGGTFGRRAALGAVFRPPEGSRRPRSGPEPAQDGPRARFRPRPGSWPPPSGRDRERPVSGRRRLGRATSGGRRPERGRPRARAASNTGDGSAPRSARTRPAMDQRGLEGFAPRGRGSGRGRRTGDTAPTTPHRAAGARARAARRPPPPPDTDGRERLTAPTTIPEICFRNRNLYIRLRLRSNPNRIRRATTGSNPVRIPQRVLPVHRDTPSLTCLRPVPRPGQHRHRQPARGNVPSSPPFAIVFRSPRRAP